MKSNDPNSLKKKRRNRALFYNILPHSCAQVIHKGKIDGINFYFRRINSHLHQRFGGCLSGGQNRQFTSTVEFKVLAKFFK